MTIARVEPAAYRVFFGRSDESPNSADLLYDVQKMCAQLERFEKGAGAQYLRFLAFAKEALDKVKAPKFRRKSIFNPNFYSVNSSYLQGTASFIEKDFRTFSDYADLPSLLPLLRHLSPADLLGQHWKVMGKFFKTPKLKVLFTFQVHLQ